MVGDRLCFVRLHLPVCMFVCCCVCVRVCVCVFLVWGGKWGDDGDEGWDAVGKGRIINVNR